MIIPFSKSDNIARLQERKVYQDIRNTRQKAKGLWKLIMKLLFPKKCLLGGK
jgi:hypothetical protein